MSDCTSKKYWCANCPIRRRGVEKPRSIFARIHRWHSGRCPAWKAFQAAQRACREREGAAI